MPVGGDDFKTVANNLYPRGSGLSCIITGEGPRSVNHVIVVHGVDDFWCPTLGQVSADVALVGPALPDGYFWVEWIVGPAATALEALASRPSPNETLERRFEIGHRVTKIKGSSWTGRIVGFYATALTPIGYCVESENEPGSVQIYPEAAIRAMKEPENG